MKDFQHCKLDDIIEDAKANKRVAELKKMVEPDEEGIHPSFITVKRAYYGAYYADMIPTAKRQKKFWDVINEL